MNSKEVSRKLRSASSTVIEIDPIEKPKNKFIDFIERLDETGEFLDLSEQDEVKISRMVRADRIAQDLNEKKYLEFQRAR